MAFDYTNAWTLLEANKHSSDTLKRGVIETLVQESPILEMLPFTPISGNAIKVKVEATLPNVQFRDVNEGYTKSFGTDTERMFGVAILGGEVFIDNFLLKVKANQVDAKALQYAKFAKAMSRTFDKQFFDGTGAAKDFMGVNALIDEGLGMEYGSATGAALTLDGLDEANDLFRNQSSADAILLNRTLRRKITNLGRNTGGGFALIDVGTDVFGRQVTQWNGIPLRIIGDDKDGNAILDFDENPGDGTSDTASIYFVAFGADENISGLSGAGGSMEVRDFGEQEAAPGHMGRVEWYPGLAIYNPYSIVRYSGITNA
jgi:HK97 family phage major capsid protein